MRRQAVTTPMQRENQSRENVELVRRAYEAFNPGDLDGMIADLAPTFEYVPSVEIRELVDAGDQALASLTLPGRGKRSGVEVRWDVWHVWTLKDGKVVRGQGFTRSDDALEAAGLRE
jgi:ketosteroid isomerase-like protein